MNDVVTANLPAKNMAETAAFFLQLGFVETFRDDGWMILKRGPLLIEFFPYPDLNEWESSFSACVRVSDVDALYSAWSSVGLPLYGIPRLTPPKDEPFGLRMAALIDPNGSLLRILGPPKDQQA